MIFLLKLLHKIRQHYKLEIQGWTGQHCQRLFFDINGDKLIVQNFFNQKFVEATDDFHFSVTD